MANQLLEQARSSTGRLSEAYGRLGRRGTRTSDEYCRLEQVSGMLKSVIIPVKALVEFVKMRSAVISMSILSQQADAVCTWVEQARVRELGKAETMDLQTNLRESYLKPAIELLSSIIDEAETILIENQTISRSDRPEPHKIPAQEEE